MDFVLFQNKRLLFMNSPKNSRGHIDIGVSQRQTRYLKTTWLQTSFANIAINSSHWEGILPTIFPCFMGFIHLSVHFVVKVFKVKTVAEWNQLDNNTPPPDRYVPWRPIAYFVDVESIGETIGFLKQPFLSIQD